MVIIFVEKVFKFHDNLVRVEGKNRIVISSKSSTASKSGRRVVVFIGKAVNDALHAGFGHI